MKTKIIVCLCTALILFTSIIVPVNATEMVTEDDLGLPREVLMGDVNKDGIISIEDVKMVLKISCGLIQATNYEYVAANTNYLDKNPLITIEDARRCLRLAAGIEKQEVLKLEQWNPDPHCSHEGLASTYCEEKDIFISTVINKIPHNIKGKTCVDCGIVPREIVELRLKGNVFHFNDNMDTVQQVLGKPLEVLVNYGEYNEPHEYHVYHKSYKNLTIVQYSSEKKLEAIYSMDPSFSVVGDRTIDINNVSDTWGTYWDDVRVKSMIDYQKNSKTYAIYATINHSVNQISNCTDKEFVERIHYLEMNALRTLNGLSIVSYSEKLSNVARDHTIDMLKNNYRGHTNLKGEEPFERVMKAGIKTCGVGEIIGSGPEMEIYEMSERFYNSLGHRQIILDKRYKTVGFGYEYNAKSKDKFHLTGVFIDIKI
jgi:uncharacterized protein YkwD